MSVAESTWAPVSEELGLQYHVVDLLDPATSNRWPDSVPADVPVTDVASFLPHLAELGNPPSLSTPPATRPQLAAVANVLDIQPATLGPGEARAGLIIAHGVLRRFFTYFSVTGDTIDQTLVEALALVDTAAHENAGGPIDRNFYHQTLGFFGHSLHDTHVYIYDYYTQLYGYINLVCEQIHGQAVVRRSGVAGIQPGDTLLSIDGIPADQWFAFHSSVDSGATPGGLFQKVVTVWVQQNLVKPTRSFGVASVDGTRRTVVTNVVSYNTPDYFGYAPSERASGPLTDLGAPDLYYLNMDDLVTPDDPTWMAAIASAKNARGMIVDMRGYPSVDHYATAQSLIPATFLSPQFGIPYVISPEPSGYSIYDEQYSFAPVTSPAFGRPLILLVGNGTLSAAENFAMLLVDAHRPLHVVGQQSSGSDGNVTGIELPGGFAFTFTGMRVTHADGSRFDGIGIIPDVEVELKAEDFAAGRDPDLEAAIRLLR